MALFSLNRPDRRKPSQEAFTLIELLAVLCILGVLIALMVPALQSAIAKSRQAKCAANLRQLWSSITLYVADNGVYPWAQYENNPTGEIVWAKSTTLGRYLGGAGTDIPGCRLFICPEHKDANAKGCRSYSANKFVMYLQWSQVTAGKLQPRPSQISRPSEVVLLGDGLIDKTPDGVASIGLLRGPINYNNPNNRENVVKPIPANEVKDYEAIDANTLDVYLSYRHLGKATVVFCDGHATALPIGSFKEKNFSIDY